MPCHWCRLIEEELRFYEEPFSFPAVARLNWLRCFNVLHFGSDLSWGWVLRTCTALFLLLILLGHNRWSDVGWIIWATGAVMAILEAYLSQLNWDGDH